jgi:regulator of protease activity HflC (stomatin/prohibitin superfamily)
MGMLVLNILLSLASIAATVYGAILFSGARVALGVTLFGKYAGTLKGAGFYFVNPFCAAVAPPEAASTTGALSVEVLQIQKGDSEQTVKLGRTNRKLSLKTMTLNNDRQKINDSLGNPIIIGIVVIWRVVDTAKALFGVDNFVEFLSIQCDSALRNIVRLYPYDAADDEASGEKSLRGSSQEIAANLRDAIQEKVAPAGLEVAEARITHLAYAPEIAAAMLQRQQAAAIVDARQLIVEGAVGMVEQALDQLNRREVVQLDEERKAAMVSNLLVVLCGNRDPQPVVNSGSLY